MLFSVFAFALSSLFLSSLFLLRPMLSFVSKQPVYLLYLFSGFRFLSPAALRFLPPLASGLRFLSPAVSALPSLASGFRFL